MSDRCSLEGVRNVQVPCRDCMRPPFTARVLPRNAGVVEVRSLVSAYREHPQILWGPGRRVAIDDKIKQQLIADAAV